MLQDGEAQTPQALRESLGISQASLARLIRALEIEGFIMERTSKPRPFVRLIKPIPIPEPAEEYVPPKWPGKAKGEDYGD